MQQMEKTTYESSLHNERILKRVYLWNFVGSFFNAFASFLYLIIVSRFLLISDGDLFSYAWSIGSIVATIGTYQIRNYQATDINNKYTFKEYRLLRCITIFVMLLVSLIYLWSIKYRGETLFVIMSVIAYYAIMDLSDVYQGELQRMGRLDLAGKALVARSLISVIVFSFVIYNSRNLYVAISVMNLASLIVLLCFEKRYLKEHKTDTDHVRRITCWIFSLLKESLPLFISAFLMMYLVNAEKLAIQELIQTNLLQQGSQIFFNIIFMPTYVINLIMIVFRPAMTEMAIAFEQRDIQKIKAIILKILSFLLPTILVVLTGAYLLGIPVLKFVYGVELNSYKLPFMILIIAGAFNALATIFDNALTAMRRQNYLLFAYSGSTIITVLIVKPLIGHLGVLGASLAFFVSMVCLSILTGIILLMVMKKHKADS